MRVGVAWVEADGFAVGSHPRLRSGTRRKAAVPGASLYCSAWAAVAAWRGWRGLAGGVGERVPDSLGAGAPGGVLGQERLKQVTQRAACSGGAGEP